jgi:hypothetical protein
MTALVADPQEIDAEWRSGALQQHAAEVSLSQSGTGQIGRCYRVHAVIEGHPVNFGAKLRAPI